MSSKLWYTLEILYRSNQETKLFRLTNTSPQKLMEIREKMFSSGLYRKIDNDTGEIVSPWQILEVMVYKQEHFFNPEQQEMKLVHSKSITSPKK